MFVVLTAHGEEVPLGGLLWFADGRNVTLRADSQLPPMEALGVAAPGEPLRVKVHFDAPKAPTAGGLLRLHRDGCGWNNIHCPGELLASSPVPA